MNRMKSGSPERKQQVAQLKRPSQRDAETYRFLRERTLSGEDQTIQCAAITGLVRLGGPQAVLTLSERLLEPPGLQVVHQTIKGLGRLAADGGALALSALLYQDTRVYGQKINALEGCATRLDHEAVLTRFWKLLLLSWIHPRFGSLRTPEVISMLGTPLFEDVWYGLALARKYRFPLGSKMDLSQSDKKSDQAAEAYAERRLPGLVHLLASHTSPSGEESGPPPD